MSKFQGAIARFVGDEEAATAAEYGLIAALIAAAIIVAVQAFGTSLNGMFTGMSGKITANTPK